MNDASLDYVPSEQVRNRFNALCSAARGEYGGRLCVMACTDTKTGEARSVVCVVAPREGGDVEFYPLAVIPEEENLTELYDYARDKSQLNG